MARNPGPQAKERVSKVRNAFHVIVSLLLWCLFGYYWYIVARSQITSASLEALAILGVIILAGLIITVWWVSHNKKLAQRNRRTTPPATVPETFDFDYLGRSLVRPDVALLQAARIIDIDIEPESLDDPTGPGKKIYSVGNLEVL